MTKTLKLEWQRTYPDNDSWWRAVAGELSLHVHQREDQRWHVEQVCGASVVQSSHPSLIRAQFDAEATAREKMKAALKALGSMKRCDLCGHGPKAPSHTRESLKGFHVFEDPTP